MGRRLPLRLLPPLGAGCALLLAAPAVGADGGRTIAAAPAASYGVPHRGTTVDAGAPCPGRLGDYFSYWKLAVTAGDVLRLDWGAQQKGTVLSLFGVGTTDARVASAAPAETEPLDEMYGQEELDAAPQPRTGALVLQIHGFVCDGGGGPYDFTAHVRHATRLTLPPRAPGGKLTVRVRAPDGGAISSRALRVTVQVRRRGAWHGVGSARVARGRAVVQLPRGLRGRRARLRAVAAGAGYVRRTGRSAFVRVT
jgi:hypothetical protein